MKRLKMGILGVEHCHMPGYAQAIKHGTGDLFEVTCVADPNVDKGERISGYLGAKYYRDYERLLEKETIDCVFLEPIVSDHTPMSIAALEKGLHVLCEKPLGTDLKNALEVYRAYKKSGVTFHIAFAARFANPMMRLRQLIVSGFLGQILGINATNPGNAHVPDYPDWTHNARYSGGGSIMDHTVHCADLMRWFMSAEIMEVYAEAAGKIRKWGVEDVAQISVLFDNGVFSTIEATWVRQPRNPEIFGLTFDVFGTRAAVSTRQWYDERIILRQEVPDLHTDMEGDGCGLLQLDPIGFYGGGYDRGIFGEFYKAIMGQPHMGADIYDGIRADQVCDAAYKSIEAGNPVRVENIE